jgi:DNA-binding NarL/FixJ family response regulator
MLMRDKHIPRLGDVGALVRASKSSQALDSAPAVATDRKRRLVAMFCEMLGEQVLDGKSAPTTAEPLSPRQRQTLELLLEGHAEKQIAARLAISKHTVHVYVKTLYKRFDVCSRAELLARWVQR